MSERPEPLYPGPIYPRVRAGRREGQIERKFYDTRAKTWVYEVSFAGNKSQAFNEDKVEPLTPRAQQADPRQATLF